MLVQNLLLIAIEHPLTTFVIIVLLLSVVFLNVIKVTMSSSSLIVNGINVDVETDSAKLRQLVSISKTLIQKNTAY